MTVHFECTQCGKCCQDLRLTLSVAEAIAWAGRGHPVQLLVEALPWPGEPDPADERAVHDRDRSFPARSGDVPIRIAAILVAYHEGGCPHLQADMRCGNYAERPRICRIYPLESRRFSSLRPESKLCPAEAWTPDRPLLTREGAIVDAEARRIVADHWRVGLEDVPAVAAACAALGISHAAFANEGLAVHAPAPEALAQALRSAREAPTPRDWTIVTNRQPTLEMLRDAGCNAAWVSRGADYLGSFADEA